MSNVQWMLRVDGIGDVHRPDAQCANSCEPVVVISPEDREQVERLVDALSVAADECEDGLRCRSMTCCGASVTQALRSLIEPPKPEEPQGFAAAVVDRRGNHWARTFHPGCSGTGKGAWSCGDMRSHYSDIDAVRVLSEGVTP